MIFLLQNKVFYRKPLFKKSETAGHKLLTIGTDRRRDEDQTFAQQSRRQDIMTLLHKLLSYANITQH